MLDSLGQYPHWLVVACSVFAGALVLWLLVKLLKAAFYILFFGVLVAVGASAAWLLFR
jgi:hypothetical protein